MQIKASNLAGGPRNALIFFRKSNLVQLKSSPSGTLTKKSPNFIMSHQNQHSGLSIHSSFSKIRNKMGSCYRSISISIFNININITKFLLVKRMVEIPLLSLTLAYYGNIFWVNGLARSYSISNTSYHIFSRNRLQQTCSSLFLNFKLPLN